MSLSHRAKLIPEHQTLYDQLTGSLLFFTQTFFKLSTNREFELTQPTSRESHYITISKALTRTQRGSCKRLIINVPPRYGKTEMCIHYVAWCLARYPDAKFMYVSYTSRTAAAQTAAIRKIINMPLYREIFGVTVAGDSSAKDNFQTNWGGQVYAVGAGGSITGHGGGLKGCERFGGSIIIDDIHKADEVGSDVMRERIKTWYLETLSSRYNDPRTPGIFIGQRLHEDDLAANLIEGYDGFDWDQVIIKALSDDGHALDESKHDVKALLTMKEKMPYMFASQMQQNPSPAGGGIFKAEWFLKLDKEPEITATFITADTAETDKTYNDATVFSFWGLYKIVQDGIESDVYGLYWLDCHECWIEPKDLKNEFMQFYRDCMRHPVKPKVAAIEKKSTGTTLVSVLSDMQGLQILEIERHAGSGNKATRFLNVQEYIASKQVTLPYYGKHSDKCIEHMSKITANNSH